MLVLEKRKTGLAGGYELSAEKKLGPRKNDRDRDSGGSVWGGGGVYCLTKKNRKRVPGPGTRDV